MCLEWKCCFAKHLYNAPSYSSLFAFWKCSNCMLNTGLLYVNNVPDCQLEMLGRHRKRRDVTLASQCSPFYHLHKSQNKSKMIEMIQTTYIISKRKLSICKSKHTWRFFSFSNKFTY